MTTRDFWHAAPRDARAALVCGAMLALFYPASFAGLRLEHGVGNWGMLLFLPLLAVGFHGTRRQWRLQREAWRLSRQGKSSGILATLESRPPARPRLFTWLAIGVVAALLAELVALALRDGRFAPGAETRLLAAVGVAFALFTARRADARARREVELRRWEAAVTT